MPSATVAAPTRCPLQAFIRPAKPRRSPPGGSRSIPEGTSRSSRMTCVSGMAHRPMAGSRSPIVRPAGAPVSGHRTARNPPIPCSTPSSKTRAKIRWSLDTPPPAAGSVMQMAGLSPPSTSPAASSFWASVTDVPSPRFLRISHDAKPHRSHYQIAEDTGHNRCLLRVSAPFHDSDSTHHRLEVIVATWKIEGSWAFYVAPVNRC